MFRTSSQALRLRKSRRPGLYRPDVILLEDRVMLSATSTVFSLDQNNSSLTLSGTFAGANIQTQGTGSLTTKYIGTLATQWDLTAHTLSFVQTGTAVTALNSGTWQPAVGGGSGSAPADYGGKVTILFITGYAAVRGLVAATSSGALALSGSGPSYSFPSTQTLSITAGTADYNAGSFGSGSASLANNSASNTASAGTFQDLSNGMYRVTGPVNVTIMQTVGGQPAVLHIIGTIVANATIPVVALGHGTPDYSTSVVATQGPKNITDPAATLTDANASANMTSMTVTLTNHPDGTAEKLAATVSGGLTSSYNAATGVLTVSGTASQAVYQSVLRTLTYQNDSATPNTANRIITVAVSDGTNSSVVRTSTVSVSAPMTGATHLGVAGFPSPVTAGTSGSVTVTALDASGHTATGYTGTVHFSSSDGQAVLPGNYAFTAADMGVHTFTNAVTLKTAATQSITATDTTTASVTGSQSGIVVNPGAAASLMVMGFPSPVTAGAAGNVTVTAKDAYGNVATGYRGTVHFSSTDGQAALPADYTFIAADNGVHTFSVTLKSAATQSITVADTGTGTINGTQSGIVVNPAATASLQLSGYPTLVVAGTAFSLTVRARDAYGNTTPGYSGTVTFSSTDAQADLPADSTLTNGVGMFAVTLRTAGSQTVTATDTNTGSITGNATITVGPAFFDHFAVSTSADAAGTVAGQAFDVTVTAQDAYGNTVTGYGGTVTFSSQDPYGATLPADYTFQASDQGQVTFAGGAALYTAGAWDVTATDTTTGQTGSDSVTVTAAAAVAFQVVAPASASSGMPFDVTVIAVDPYGNTDTNYQGTVTFSSSDTDPGVILPADYTFQASDAGMATFPGGVTLITVGDQTITATDVDSGITGSATVTVTSPGPNTGRARHARQHTALDGLFAADAHDRWDARAWATLEAALAHRNTNGHPVDAVLMGGLI